jgi:hypothetical protein
MTLKEMEAKGEMGRMVTQMSTRLKKVSDRWEEVCRTYGKAWKDAYDAHSQTLSAIQKVKVDRKKAEAAAIGACLQLACVFLPMIGGAAAVAFAPILSTRARLFVNTMSRRATSKWTSFASSRPITAQVLQQIGDHSKSKAGEAAEKIKASIVDALSPKPAAVKALPAVTDPVNEFILNSRLTLDFMNTWVDTCAKWDLEGGVNRLIIPVAFDLFMNHPWVKSAPPIEESAKMLGPMTGLIEMALWFRWAKGLDEKYWQAINDWYENEYRFAGQFGQDVQSRGRKYSEVVDALDFQPVLFRLDKITNFRRFFSTMTLISPKTKLGHPTINLHQLQKTAKNPGSSSYILGTFLPSGSRQDDLLKELVRM